jgi:hypothetical protein
MATQAPTVRQQTWAREPTSPSEAPSDPLDPFRGLALALPIALRLWIACSRAAGGCGGVDRGAGPRAGGLARPA